jgi:hypothetical protein
MVGPKAVLVPILLGCVERRHWHCVVIARYSGEGLVNE